MELDEKIEALARIRLVFLMIRNGGFAIDNWLRIPSMNGTTESIETSVRRDVPSNHSVK